MADEEKLSISDLGEYEAGEGIEVGEYEGTRVDIEGYEIIKVPQKYHPKTGVLSSTETYEVQKLKVFSKPVAEVEGKEGKKIQIRGSELFNLKLDDDDKWKVSTSPKASINAFLTKLKLPVGLEGVKRIGEPGQSIVLKVTNNKVTGQDWLGFSY